MCKSADSASLPFVSSLLFPSSTSACQLAVHLCEVFDLLFSKVTMYVCVIWLLAVLCLFMMDGTLQSGQSGNTVMS